MPLLGTAASNAAMNAVLVNATSYFATLHTASPGTTGANENGTAGTTITRGTFSVGAASGGVVSNAAQITITLSGTPATTANTHLGVFTAATAGTYQIGAALGSNVTAATVTIAPGAAQFTAS